MHDPKQSLPPQAIDAVEGLRHPAIFRFGDMPPAQDLAVASGFAALDRELGGGWPTARLIELLCDRVGVGELSLLLPTMPKLISSSGAPSNVAANFATSAASHRANSSKRATKHLANEAQRSLWILQGGSRAAQPAQAAHAARAVHTTHAPLVPYAPALEARGVDLRRFAIAQTSSNQETLWAMEQALLSNAVKGVFAWLADRSQREPHDFALRRISLAARKSESLCFLMRPLSAARRATPAELRIAITPASRHEIEITILKRRGLLRETSLRIDPRELACLAPHRMPIAMPSAATSARNPAVSTNDPSRLASVLNAAKHASLDTPPNIRQRSFIVER
jgi:hypothetical protein